MTTATPEKTDGLKALQIAIEEIDKTIQGLGGVFKIQMPVKQFMINIYFLTNLSHNICQTSDQRYSKVS